MAKNDKIDPSTLPIEEVAALEGTDMQKGLTAKQAADILERDGLNELKKPPRPTLLMLFLIQMTGFIIILLMIAAVASIAVNATGSKASDGLSYTTGIAIFVIVFLNAGIAAWTEHQAGGALEALAKMTQASVNVLRDGAEITVATVTVVRGDVVVLGTGDVVPADLRLMVADDVKVAEMCLTGEPDDVAKNARLKVKKEGAPEKLTPENMVFSGCSCTNGKGKGIVTQTGMGTRIGEIAALMQQEDDTQKKRCGCLPDTSANGTPLQKNVESLGAKIGVLAIIVCVGVFIIGAALDTRDPDNQDSSTFLYMILIAVTLAVAAIPEGIPLCVTISLSLGCSDMVKQNVLVRKLAAVETLGSASVICSDKTGTLTEGKMTMVQMWAGNTKYDVTGKGFDPTVGTITQKESGASGTKDIGVVTTLFSSMLCSNTTLSKVRDPDTKEEKWEPKGNSSEAPLVVAGMKLGFSTDFVAANYKRTLEIPFSSSRKMMLTVTDVSGKGKVCDGGLTLPSGTTQLTVCKGAPNFIMDICTSMVGKDGSIKQLTAADKEFAMAVVDEYSSQALRVLAVAIRPMDKMPFDLNDDDVATDTKFELCREDLQLVGLVASIDPDRDGVQDSVVKAQGAGIRVVMITGDYLQTAIAIAKNVKILQDKDNVDISAVDCNSLRPGEQYLEKVDMDKITAHVKVFARAKPEDKLEIVKSLQRQGQVSAMTGDGVNDAPALNQADIGVAMGIQGTEVAKGASDMILTDDNFCSIVTAVEKGRAIYAGIQKFVAFIMSVHIAEVMQIFVCIVAKVPVMRTPLQILFLILVTDLPPSIALGMEPGEANILKMRPRPKTEPIVLMWMWISIVLNGTILTISIMAVYLISLNHYCDGNFRQDDILAMDGYEEKLMNARTVAFISLVYSENIRAYISRSFDQPVWRGFFKNKNMHKAIIAAQIALYIAVLVPFLSDKILQLSGTSIGAFGWLLSFAGPVATTIMCEIAKILTWWQSSKYQEKLRKEQDEQLAKQAALLDEATASHHRKQPQAAQVVEVKQPPSTQEPEKVPEPVLESAPPVKVVGTKIYGI